MVFIDAGQNLVMADDVAMPSNPPVSLVKKEEFEKALLDMNVSQRLCEKKSSRRMVRTQVDRSAWDRRLFPNLHALVIYLEIVPACGAAPKRFEKCQCEDNDVRLVELGFPVMTIIVGCEAQSTPFPWSIKPNT